MGHEPCHCSSSTCTHTRLYQRISCCFVQVHVSLALHISSLVIWLPVNLSQFYSDGSNKQTQLILPAGYICWFQGKAITWFKSCVLCQLIDLECDGEQYYWYWTESSRDFLSPAHPTITRPFQYHMVHLRFLQLCMPPLHVVTHPIKGHTYTFIVRFCSFCHQALSFHFKKLVFDCPFWVV
jgi:hypothetical protein